MTRTERATIPCIFCGDSPGDTSDHVPPKQLLRKPYPKDLLTVPACRACNLSFSADEEYFRLVVIGLYCHTPEAEQLFDGALSRSMDRRAALEELMFGSLRPAGTSVIVDLDYARIERIVGKVVRGLAYVLRGIVYPPSQAFEWDFFEVDSPSDMVAYGPDFTYTCAAAPTASWEFTFFHAVRFTARPA